MTLPYGKWDPTWKRCFDCEIGVPAVDWNRHLLSHIDRPSEDAMTLPEVAIATGIRLRQLQRRAAAGKMSAFTTVVGRRTRWWVHRAEVSRIVKLELRKNPGMAVTWAATGKLK